MSPLISECVCGRVYRTTCFLLLSLVSVGCAGSGTGLSDLPDPHHHVINVHDGTWSIAPDDSLRFIQVASIAVEDRRGQLRAPDTRTTAYLADSAVAENRFVEHLYVQDDFSGETYRLAGVPLPHRTYSSLVWINEHYLTFDRWSQPHYGLHFVVDVRQPTVIYLSGFPDKFFLEQQNIDTTDNQQEQRYR